MCETVTSVSFLTFHATLAHICSCLLVRGRDVPWYLGILALPRYFCLRSAEFADWWLPVHHTQTLSWE
jgi:hypothetical protein